MATKPIPKSIGILALGMAGILSLAINSFAQVNDDDASSAPAPSITADSANSAQIQAYWTADRMANAQAMTIESSISPGEITGGRMVGSSTDPEAKPVLIPGWDPNSGLPQPGPDARVNLEIQASSSGANAPAYGFNQAPANPIDYGNYGKYQRYTMMRNYLVYPSSILGKLFFSNGGSNFVCSATVVNRDTIITAGHCVSNGSGTFYTNFLFCPSYYRATGSGAPHPSRGCWAWSYATTSTEWHNSNSFDRDYACIVTNTTGTVVADNVGDVTGWGGMAYNRGADELVSSTGYPQGAPFAGYHIITTFAPEWYTSNRAAGDPAVSKYIGNDMTGGSSGGGWLLDWEHRTFRYNAVDSSNATDPYQNGGGGPYVHGVNSHKRCMAACTTPPTATQGIFTNEMGSPMFEMNTGDTNDVESVYGRCLANGGS